MEMNKGKIGYFALWFITLLLSIFLIKSLLAQINPFGSWKYKVRIAVYNPGGAKTNTPVRIEVPTTPYINSGRMNADLSDIRFSQGQTNLPFWIHITEGMNRNSYSLPIYVKMDYLAPGTNTIYMHFDKNKNASSPPTPPAPPSYSSFLCQNPGPGVDFSSFTSCHACRDNVGKPLFPFSGKDAGKSVFPLFAYDLRDQDEWNKSGTKSLSKGTFSTFTFHVRTHFYVIKTQWTVENEVLAYFLSQATSPQTIATSNGYKLYINYLSTDTDPYHYQRGRYMVKLFYKKNETSPWSEVSSATCYIYQNTIHDWDIIVGDKEIRIIDNGEEFISYKRTDGFSNGRVGFEKLPIAGGECGGNSTDGISPIWVSSYSEEPLSVEIMGNPDLEIKRIRPDPEDTYFGKELIEYPSAKQLRRGYVRGNNLETYIYRLYQMAKPNQQFEYGIKMWNRGDESDLFNIYIKPKDMRDWSLIFKYNGDFHEFLPDGSNLEGTISVPGKSSFDLSIIAIPGEQTLFNGGDLDFVFEVKGGMDLCSDEARFISYVRPRLECHWKKKLPITISYADTYKTGELLDYQVLIDFKAYSDLQFARADGSDIIFTDLEGAVIPFWMKKWDYNNKDASFWVKVPKINALFPQTATTTIYMWMGNCDYLISRSNKKETFDLWEDWEDRNLNSQVGDCLSYDAICSPDNGWQNVPTPQNNYNWWYIKERLDNKALMADKGSTFKSSGIGPFITGGDIQWKNYEVSYSFYGEYNNYGGDNDRSNPQYNPVCHQDPGNTWGMEFFATGGGLYIFRPFADGTDWTWQYQSKAGKILGDSTFPMFKKRYWVKVRPFYNNIDKKTYLSLLVANNPVSDEDLDIDYKYLTERKDEKLPGFIAPSAYASMGGAIGFGGRNGGFSFDNIRVRKFVYPAPTVSLGGCIDVAYSPIRSLSFSNITQPLMNGRPCIVISSFTPWSWRGDLFAYYADCYIGGICQKNETKTDLSSISFFGKEGNAPKGFGSHLREAKAGLNNRENIDDSNWKENGRVIFTTYDRRKDGKIRENDGFLNFEVLEKDTLRPLLFAPDDPGSATEVEDLIKFIRGYDIERYPRSKARRIEEGNQSDTNQWKLGDVIHSNPLVVGLPVMSYLDPDYAEFVRENSKRDLVVYFGSNDGMIHAVRLAKWNEKGGRYEEEKSGCELWNFIPNALLKRLKETTDGLHEYTLDGKLRAIDLKLNNEYRTVLIGTLRTGGQAIFALDITNPRMPTFLWEINNDTNSNEFQAIGKTFSQGALGKLKIQGQDRWVGIFGSGLSPDPSYNLLSKKAYLTVVDLKDGNIVKQIKVSGKMGNITTDISLIRGLSNDSIQKVFFGDYFGALWFIDLSTDSLIQAFLDKGTLTDNDLLFKPKDYNTSNMIDIPPERPISSPPVAGCYDIEKEDWFVYFGTGDYDLYSSDYPYQRLYGLREFERPPTKYFEEDNLYNFDDVSCGTETRDTSFFLELGKPCIYDYAFQGGGSPTITSKDRNERILNPPDVFSNFLFFTTFTPNRYICEQGTGTFYAIHSEKGTYVEGLIEALGTETRNVRSISYNIGVLSSPLVFFSGGKVAAGVINTKTGEPITVEMNEEEFLKYINIILWREIR